MRKYLRRELCLLELDDAEYFQYTPSVPDFRYMSIILEQEYEFNYLSKSPVQPMYHLYAAPKEEKLRAFLACFDAEVLLYFDSKLDQKTPCLIIFLCCVRYLAKQIKLKDWEGKKYNHLDKFHLRWLKIKEFDASSPSALDSLRVVQTQAILFLKSMTERGGSDIERLRISITSSLIDLESI